MASSLAGIGGCAVVFGLDEPTVREGAGGASGTDAAATNASASSGDAPSPAAGGGDPGSSGSGATCDDADDCDDDDPCTVDDCVAGACAFDPAPDGPLPDVPDDCVDTSCRDGEEVAVADDSEDPADANPPCDVTVCEDGVAVQRDADAGTSCGAEPLVCDGGGNCVGCTPRGEDECGEPTECSTPICLESQMCDPGYLDAGTEADDPTPGDCLTRECTGASVSAVVVADDTDLPADTPCGDARCAEGVPSFEILVDGTPCNGQDGVCDGAGTDSSNCKTCRDTENTEPDPGCQALVTPHCDEDAGECRECTSDPHCQGNDQGEDCRSGGVCGCTSGAHCSDSSRGRYCNFSTSRCTCLSDNDCNGPGAAGARCLGGGQGCGCLAAADCEDNDAGAACVDGACGCNDDEDCEGADTCDPISNRCVG